MKKTKNGIDLKEYGMMCEKIDGLEERLDRFIDNEFKHLARKVDGLLYLLVASLVGVAVDLVLRLVK